MDYGRSLLNSHNYFLHFPGLWIEGEMWKNNKILNNKALNEFRYYDIASTGTPKGMIRSQPKHSINGES
jgi:hypothetical protein